MPTTLNSQTYIVARIWLQDIQLIFYNMVEGQPIVILVQDPMYLA